MTDYFLRLKSLKMEPKLRWGKLKDRDIKSK